MAEDKEKNSQQVEKTEPVPNPAEGAKTKPVAKAAPVVKTTQVVKNTTVLGQETVFDGIIEFTDNLIITGTFKGTIKASGDLEIDKTGICTVDEMSANSVVISGKVTGDIRAPERVELCSGSAVRGTIETGRLRISDNVDFEGSVAMIDSVPDVDLFSVVSEEYKQGLVLKSDAPR